MVFDHTIETIFRVIISTNQLSLYGAVPNICEEFEARQDRSGEPDVLMGQSIVLGEIKAEVLLQNENPSHHQILWQQCMKRIESLSQESKVSKFCLEAGFVHVVEVGQYFMTKDTGDFLDNFVQWLVANTLFPEMMNHHNQEDRFKETRELDLYWKSQPVFNTANMGLKFESGLWVKIILSLGSEYPMEQINMWSTQITTTQKFLQIYLKNKRHNRV